MPEKYTTHIVLEDVPGEPGRVQLVSIYDDGSRGLGWKGKKEHLSGQLAVLRKMRVKVVDQRKKGRKKKFIPPEVTRALRKRMGLPPKNPSRRFHLMAAGTMRKQLKILDKKGLGRTSTYHYVMGRRDAHRSSARLSRMENPRSGPVDRDAARELELFLMNDAELYEKQFMPTIRNLLRRLKRGEYKPELAVRLWMNFVDNGSRKYVREVGVVGSPVDAVFNRATRLAVARDIEQDQRKEMQAGNYD